MALSLGRMQGLQDAATGPGGGGGRGGRAFEIVIFEAEVGTCTRGGTAGMAGSGTAGMAGSERRPASGRIFTFNKRHLECQCAFRTDYGRCVSSARGSLRILAIQIKGLSFVSFRHVRIH